MSRALLAWSGALIIAAAATAQERRLLSGDVRDGAGKPVANATVWLAGETTRAWLGVTDVVQAVTDREGHFRSLVLECVEYDAWAVGPERADGSWLASAPARCVTPGPRLDLCARPISPRMLRCDGLGAWPEAGPFRARLWQIGCGFAREVQFDAAGSAPVPREWPATGAQVEMLDSRGQTITLLRVDGSAWTASVPAPQPLEVMVAFDNGKPVAGARVERVLRAGELLEPLGYRSRRMRTPLGTTDAAGLLRCVVAPSGDASDRFPFGTFEIRAHKEGLADAYAGCLGGTLVTAQGPSETAGDALRLRMVMQPAMPFRGEVLLAPERPLAGCEVQVCTRDHVRTERVGFYMDEQRRSITDARGQFAIDHLAQETKCMAVWLGAAALRAIAGEQRRERAFPPGQPFLLAAVVVQTPQLRIDLSQCSRIALQVVDEGGGPASSALVVLQSEAGEPTYLSENDPRFRLDPAGRATVLLARGKWFVCVTDGERGLYQTIEVAAGEQALRLLLKPWPRLRGEVRDAAGKPVAGVRMQPQSYGPGSGHRDYLHVTLLQRWMPRVVTDDQGRFDLPFLPDTRVEYTVRMVGGERSSEPFVLRDPGEVLAITLR